MRHGIKMGAVGLGLAATLVISGCSSSGGDEGGDVTIQMVESLTSPARTQLLRGILDDFEQKNPGIKVELTSPPTDQGDQKIQQMLQAATGIDVMEVRDITLTQFVNNGWLYNMSDDLEGWDGWDAMTDNAVKFSTVLDDSAYWIPFGFGGLTLFYRTDLVAEAGFDGPPETWEELLEQAEAIQDPSKNQFGYAFRGAFNANYNAYIAIAAAAAADIQPDNARRLKNGDSVFAHPAALAALENYVEIFKRGSAPSAIAWGYPEMVEAFNNGSTAFLLQDPEVIAAISESSVITAEQWSTARLPKGPGPDGKAVQPIAVQGWGIAASSEVKPEAVKLIQFLSSGDASLQFTKGNTLIPILKSAAEDPFFSEGAWRSYVEMAAEPDVYLTLAFDQRDAEVGAEYVQKADAELQRVLLGESTPQEYLDIQDAFWTKLWASRG